MKALFACIIFALLVNSGLQLIQNPEKIVFCNVGQGDGIYIHSSSGQDIVIDAGLAGTEMGQCLARHMSYFDRSIDVAINSHSDKDHYGGFLETMKRYDIGLMVLNPLINMNKDYQVFLHALGEKKIQTKEMYQGDTIVLNSKTKCDLFWPESGMKSSELKAVNASSYIFNCSFGDLDILFTGDVTPDVINKVTPHLPSDTIEILKIPHHGSKNGLTKTSLEKIQPFFAAVEVGIKNTYGHPHQEILDMLKNQNVTTQLTSNGDIIVYPEKKGFYVIQQD